MPVVAGADGIMMRFVGATAAIVLLLPELACGMAGDGALLTNTVSATYHGVAGVGVKYTVSYLATSSVMVSCPVVGVVKRVMAPTTISVNPPYIPYQNVGGTVTFSVCVFNNSLQASAFGMTMRDRMAANTTWAGVYGSWGATFTQAQYSTNGTNYFNIGAGAPAVGTVPPVYLYWRVDALGPGRSACATYAVKIQ